MPRDGKTGLTLADETVDALREHKADGETWDQFLQRLAEEHDPRVYEYVAVTGLDADAEQQLRAIIRDEVSSIAGVQV